MDQTVGAPESVYMYYKHVFLVRRAHIDGYIQKSFQKTIEAKSLYASKYLVMSIHPGARRMYDKMRTDMYWTHMANDVYATVKYFRSCATTRVTAQEHQKHL